MKKNPIWILLIGIFILIVPVSIYLGFIIPKLEERYIILTASSGMVSGAGMGAAMAVPEKWKYSSLYKLSIKSATLLIASTLVNEFYIHLIGVIATFIVSYIIYRILKGVWKNERRRKENRELAEEIARNIDKNS